MQARGRGFWRLLGHTLLVFLTLGLIASAALLWYEVSRSPLQARYFSEQVQRMTYGVEPGPSDAIRFPGAGPFDVRLGYSALPERAERLASASYEVTAQSR